MRYRMEIIADSVPELVTKLRVTCMELMKHTAKGFLESISTKGMPSVFFTKYSNIHVYDPDEKECEECNDTGLSGVLNCPDCGYDEQGV